MTLRRRVCVFKLFHGGFLGPDGRGTGYDISKRVQFYYEDALRFWRILGHVDRSDYLHGMSLEMLPKRSKLHHPMTPDQVDRFIATIKTARFSAEADRYDRLAEGYKAQAKHAEHMAEQMREAARQFRAKAERNDNA